MLLQLRPPPLVAIDADHDTNGQFEEVQQTGGKARLGGEVFGNEQGDIDTQQDEAVAGQLFDQYPDPVKEKAGLGKPLLDHFNMGGIVRTLIHIETGHPGSLPA